MNALSFTEATEVLRAVVPHATVTELGALEGAQTPCWDEVIIERFLPEDCGRWDIMGALSLRRRLGELPSPWKHSRLVDLWSGGARLGSLLWFEWDMHRVGSPSPAPLCSVCVSDSILGDRAETRVPTQGGELGALHEAVLTGCGRAVDIPAVRRLVETLGDDGELLHIADLAPRGKATRLCFFVRSGAVLSWLQRSGWSGPTGPVRQALFSACPPWERTAIQLELDDHGALMPYLGVESREWASAVPRPQVALWQRAWGELEISCSLELVATWARWAGTRVEVGGVPALGFIFFKLAYQEGRWLCKAYLGVRAIG